MYEIFDATSLVTALTHTETSLTCIPVLSYPSLQSLQVASCRSPLLDPHEEMLSSHPSVLPQNQKQHQHKSNLIETTLAIGEKVSSKLIPSTWE